jgi:hypothetical protein
MNTNLSDAASAEFYMPAVAATPALMDGMVEPKQF